MITAIKNLHGNYPATTAEAAVAGRHWPDGLLHGGQRPKTLRESLNGVDDDNHRDRRSDA